MVAVDTDVLLLQFVFHRDERQQSNKLFWAQVMDAPPAITIYNLMEFLGHMSFNLTSKRLSEWRSWLVDDYNLAVLFPVADPEEAADSFYRNQVFESAFAKINKERMGYLDALALNLAERTPEVSTFVTWNAKHFKDKSSLQILTPTEYLEQ